MSKGEKERREPYGCWEKHSRQGKQPVQRPCGVFEKPQEVRGTRVDKRKSRKVRELTGHRPHHG